MSKAGDTKPKTLMTHLVAGGSAGLIEACTCHPLDTIKVRMQLSKSGSRGVGVIIKILPVLSIYFPRTNFWM
jgi:solute carrier family 25 citrate transporter 1